MVRVVFEKPYGGRGSLRLFNPRLWLTAQPQPVRPYPGPDSVIIRAATASEIDTGYSTFRRHREGWASDPHVGWVIEQSLSTRTGIWTEPRKWMSVPFQHVKTAKATAEQLWPTITGWECRKSASIRLYCAEVAE